MEKFRARGLGGAATPESRGLWGAARLSNYCTYFNIIQYFGFGSFGAFVTYRLPLIYQVRRLMRMDQRVKQMLKVMIAPRVTIALRVRRGLSTN